MSPRFPALEILPQAQRRLWDELGAVPDEFTLYGGTALALQLGHRESVDFDLFGAKPFDPDQVYGSLPFLQDAEVLQRDVNTLTCRVDRGGPVLISFFGVPRLPRIDSPLTAPGNGLRVAGLRDLAGTKAHVVQKRAEAKDYIDLDALIGSGIDLPTILAAGAALYGSVFNPQITLKALSYFEDGDLALLPPAVRSRLQNVVPSVDLDLLPILSASLRQ